jgi:5'-nucleotidase
MLSSPPSRAPKTPRLASLALVALLAGCTVTRDNPNLVGQDIRLTFIHTSDIHSRLFPYNAQANRFDEGYGLRNDLAPFGGAARMAEVVKGIRATSARSLWLDSGDSFQGAPVFNMFHGEVELRSLSLMGMDAAVVGNHEFDLGSENLFQQIANWAQFPLLAANYEWEDPVDPTRRSLRDVVQPYVIFDLDGLKVGVIGMGNWSSMTGILEGGNSLGIRPRDDAQVVDEFVRLLRPVVDVVVVLSHLGLDEDEGLGSHQVEDENEALPLEGVDVVLGGHLHIVLNPPKSIPNDELGHSTVMAHSGAFAKYVGRLDVVVRVGSDNQNPETRSRVTAFSYQNIPLTTKDPRDPTRELAVDAEITDLLWPYSVEINREFDLQGVFSYVNAGEANGRIPRNSLAGGDSQLGNLVARSMQLRTGVEADFALTNSLGIRADFEAGPLTVEQMFNVFPFENSITVMFLSGSEIQEMLDFVARRSAGRGCRTQAQVAGIWFDMVCGGDCPDGAPACAKNIYLGEGCRGGNPDGPIDPDVCTPIELTGLYKVAVNDFIARGGSGFEVLKRNTSKQDTGVPLREALVDFLRSQPVCDEAVMDQTTGMAVRDAYGAISCLDESIEPTDGRIRAVFE